MRKPGKPSLWAKLGSGRSAQRPEPPAEEPQRSKADVLVDREEVVITKTVEKHRRLILRRAQQYRSFFINTNQRIVGVSLAVLVVASSGFGGLVYFSLYRDQSYSDFSYNMTRVLPLPVAKVGSTFVPYEDYLRDLRRQVHYFETQQGMDFSQPEEDAQVTLDELKNASMKRVIDRVYVSKLATERNLGVSEAEIDARLALLQSQGKLGDDLEDIEKVLDNFWGLSLAEYRQIVAANILEEKVTRALDKELGNDAMERMETILRSLNGGEDFAELAIAYSEDSTTAINGGRYNFPLELGGREEDPLILQAVFETPPGQFSEIIDTGERLEVVKVLEDEGNGRRRAAHIRISYLLLDEILAGIRDEEPATVYIDDVTYAVF